MERRLDRTFFKTYSHEDAQAWNRRRMWSLTPDERMAIARTLRERVYGKDAPDVRESERSKHEG